MTAVAGVVLAAGALAASLAPGPRVRLPTAADAVTIIPEAQTIFFDDAIETRLPGRVEDLEQVRVSLGLDGRPVAVEVEQRLTVHGLGDFEFRVPGPAADVEPLPESRSQPGLRRGSVIWQGFSPGERVVGATMTMFPQEEEKRLPVRASIAMTIGGRPVDGVTPLTGALDIRVTLTNTTPIPIEVKDAAVDPVAAGAALDAVRGALRDGRRPVPGRGGVPEALSVSGKVGSRTEAYEAPFRYGVRISLPRERVSELQSGGRLSEEGAAWVVDWEGRLGGSIGDAGSLEETLTLTGNAAGLTMPGLTMEVAPVPPAAGVVGPPAGAPSWRQWAARTSPGAAERRSMLRRLMGAMWRTALLRQYDDYLGNPDPLGPARTTYSFVLDPPDAVAAPPPVQPRAPAGPLTVVGAALGGLALAFGALLVWARS